MLRREPLVPRLTPTVANLGEVEEMLGDQKNRGTYGIVGIVWNCMEYIGIESEDVNGI